MKALVTGSTGFIGRRLVLALVGRNDAVSCLIRPATDARPLRSLPVSLASGDFADADSLLPAVEGQDCVFHVAGVVQAVDEAAFEEGNVRSTQNLIRACLRAEARPKRFVYVSSIAAAGPNTAGRPLRESDEPRPVSAYGRTKLAAERAVLAAADRLAVTIVRPPNVLGPGSKELERAVGLLRWRLRPSLGDGRPQTSLIDVDDLVAALCLAAESPRGAGQVYFVNDGRAYAWPEVTGAVVRELGVRRLTIPIPFRAQLLVAGLAESVADILRRPPLLTRDLVRAARNFSWISDGSRIELDLGFRPRYTLRDSVGRAVADIRSRRLGRPGIGDSER